MKSLSTILIYVCLNIYLTGCTTGGSANSDTEAVVPAIPSQPSGPSQPATFPLTYYTMVVNQTVTVGGHSYPVTVTGHCVVYNSDTYCWDDGWQTVPAINYETDFWGICKLNGVVNHCSGGGSIDPVTAPTLWAQPAIQNIAIPQHLPSDVFTHGIASPVTCTLTGAIVNCVDFSIDTNQAPL